MASTLSIALSHKKGVSGDIEIHASVRNNTPTVITLDDHLMCFFEWVVVTPDGDSVAVEYVEGATDIKPPQLLKVKPGSSAELDARICDEGVLTIYASRMAPSVGGGASIVPHATIRRVRFIPPEPSKGLKVILKFDSMDVEYADSVALLYGKRPTELGFWEGKCQSNPLEITGR